jgi:Domain of unknown function (DUF6794)
MKNSNLSFEEIVEDMRKEIFEQWSEEERNTLFLSEYSNDSLIMYHHTLGRYIRNKYHLWDIPWEPELIDDVDHSPNHPDNISMEIIREIWKRGQK